MEKGHSTIPMGRNTKAIGMKTFGKVPVPTPIQITIPMRANGRIIKDMEKECTHMPQQVCEPLIEFVHLLTLLNRSEICRHVE